MEDTNKIYKKLNDIEKMLWDDRRFLIKMMIEVNKITKFVNDVVAFEENIFGQSNAIDEEKVLKSIMEDLKDDIDDKRDEFIKYHKMINSDQVGES